MIRAILFDFTGTLVDSADGFRAAEKHAQAHILQHLKSEKPVKRFPDPFFLEEYRQVRKGFSDRAVNFSRADMWAAVCEAFDTTPDHQRLAGLEREYWNIVRDRTVIFPEAIEVLTQLKHTYRLAVLTNKQGPGISESHSLARFGELAELLPATVIAGEGAIPAKPDAAAFAMALACVQTDAAEAVFVGDDWRVDIRGARDAGIQPIWIKHHRVSRNWPDAEFPCPTIDRLDALLELPRLLES